IYTIYNEKDEYQLLGGSYSGNLLPQDSYMNLYYREDGIPFAAEPAAEKLRGLVRFQINPDIYQKGYHDSDLRKRATLKAVYAKNEDGEFTYVAPYANKFKGTLVDGGSSASLLNDYPVYRYADALLMLAMAKALLNEDPGTEINLVRERAYGQEYFAANRSTLAYPNDVDAAFYADNKYGAPDTDPVEAVLKERLRELMLEGKRWYDLRLVGDPYIYKYSLANENRLLWPINEDALTNNPALEQTEGY
ncbi:MAG: RagB/SusD family nutrient uptake outer membrane protein, partial [Tannerellaceae bacterium]|nr:RagB/SusD family nutrient uptake outer membrane protein [Tannerellaceae bacterium]